jgi:hypothetical protein
MKCNAWTIALIGAGVVSLPAVTQADEATNAVPALLTSLASTTLSGYVDTSAHWNPGTGNANLPNYTPNGAQGGTKADGFNLNVVNLTISHPAGDGWSAGYNATLLMGPDAVGYNNTFGTPAGDLSLKDAYVDLHAPICNGLDVKLGTFTSPLGYEVYETGNNPNYTRSYGYEIEPTALTGLLATYQVCGPLSISGGVANTWSAGINSRAFIPGGPVGATHAESYKTYLGYATYTFPTNTGFLSGSTVSGGVVNGWDAVNGVVKTSYYVGGTINTPINNLKAGAAFDYCTLGPNNLGFDYGTGAALAEGEGYQEAIGLYASFQATEKLSLYARGEYFRQSGYLQFNSVNPNYSGLANGAYELTATAQYDLWKNVLARVEFRWDHAEHNDPYGGTAGTAVLGTGGAPPVGNKSDEYLLAANFIYKF